MILLLALPDHHKDECGDKVYSQEATDESQKTLSNARPWRVADTEENGVFAFDGIAVALSKERGALGWHGGVCVMISIRHIALWLIYPRFVKVIVVM